MQQTISRRSAVAGIFASAAALGLAQHVSLAQEATPAATPEPMGADLSLYPQFYVNITGSGIKLPITQIPTGWVMLNVTNASSEETSAGVMGPGDGQTIDDLTTAMATPSADSQGFPPFIYTATILGGPGELQPGQTAQALLNISAGDWLVFAEGDQPPVSITAVESAKSNPTAPTPDLTVMMEDFAFSGLESVSAGEQIWEVTNVGQQPHMLAMGKIPDGTTMDQLMATVLSVDMGTPTAGSLSPDQVEFLPDGVLMLSKGQIVYLPITLAEGTYAALCFVTDPVTGQSHVMEGMAAIFSTSGDAATPTS